MQFKIALSDDCICGLLQSKQFVFFSCHSTQVVKTVVIEGLCTHLTSVSVLIHAGTIVAVIRLLYCGNRFPRISQFLHKIAIYGQVRGG